LIPNYHFNLRVTQRGLQEKRNDQPETQAQNRQTKQIYPDQ
jgi:hypothetical protein